jgi:hypothetical protein
MFALNVKMTDLANTRVARIRTALNGAGMRNARVEATERMAEVVRDYMQAHLREPKGGQRWSSPPLPPHWRVYSRRSGIQGGFPASQYGDLVNSIRIEQTRAGNANLVVGEGLERPYHVMLEFGAPSPLSGRFIHMPFVRPSVEAMRGEAISEARRALVNFLNNV